MELINALLIFSLAVPLGLGTGGGGLFLVYVGDVLQFPRDTAVYLNLVFFLCALLSSAVTHLKCGRISFPFLGRVLLFGIPAALLGRGLAAMLPRELLRILLGLFMLSAGFFGMIPRKKPKEEPNSLDKR